MLLFQHTNIGACLFFVLFILTIIRAILYVLHPFTMIYASVSNPCLQKFHNSVRTFISSNRIEIALGKCLRL